MNHAGNALQDNQMVPVAKSEHYRVQLNAMKLQLEKLRLDKKIQSQKLDTIVNASQAEIKYLKQQNEDISKRATFFEKKSNELLESKQKLEKDNAILEKKFHESSMREKELEKDIQVSTIKLEGREKELQDLSRIVDVSENKATELFNQLDQALNTISSMKKKEEELLQYLQFSGMRVKKLEKESEELKLSLDFLSKQAEQSKRNAHESKMREESYEVRLHQAITYSRELESRESLSRERDKELIEELKVNTEDKIKKYEKIAAEAENELEKVEGRVNEVEKKLKENTQSSSLLKQWVVKESEIHITEEEEIGCGAWGSVRKACFRGTLVAAKTIHNQIHSDHIKQVFLREMNMAAQLRHPNLVQFIGATLEGNMVILSELMKTSLRKEIQKEPLPSSQTCSIGKDVAKALNYLHLMQPDPIVHRDVSSSNVLLEQCQSNHWKAKLADYGSVNLLCHLKTENPGSPAYSAPESCNPREQSPKMDIYSLGALLLEMKSGELPVLEDRKEHYKHVRKLILLELIKECLCENKKDRPDATSVLEKLDSVFVGKSDSR